MLLSIPLLLAFLLLSCTHADTEAPTQIEAPATHFTYVALGDSTVAGVGATRPQYSYVGRLHTRLQERYPNAHFANLGVSGARSNDVLAGQLDRAIELQPNLVTVSIGPNDITAGRDAEQFEQSIQPVFRRLREETQALVVATLLPDMTATKRFSAYEEPLVDRQVHLFNQVLREQGARFGVELVDLYGPSKEQVPEHPEWLASDGYHPSDLGYERWADAMWPTIESLLP